MNKFSFYFFILLACLVEAQSVAQENDALWGNAVWIEYSKDNRDAKWATREIVRNSPPFDIESWKPTAADLKAVSRKTHLSPLLRRAFTIDKQLKSASVTVCGLGLYELHINGKKVGDRVLDPAQTSYDKRAFYVKHDVAENLNVGLNALGLKLGNGFFGQNMAFTPRLSYGNPRAILVLDIVYQDGSTQQLTTDDSWKATSGPIVFDNIYHGETYDARKAIENWSHPSLDDKLWDTVEVVAAPTHNLIEQALEPIRKIRKVMPVAILPSDNGWILDMGQNMTGWLQIQVNERSGTAIKMRFAEHLMPDKKNIDPASTGIHVTGNTQTDIYICKGDGVETWEPTFTYHGFRYVQIEGLSQKPTIDDFAGWLVRTDVEKTGTFACSDALINTFYEVSMWTIEDNIQGILTDCPHRERCAWMGDIYVVAEAASFNFDMKRMWDKTSADMQTMLGVAKVVHNKNEFPYDMRAPANISVGKRLCNQARPDWGAATVMVPWYAYVYYGDKTIIQNAWSMMQDWMAFLYETKPDGILTDGYGDWCPPGGNPKINTPVSLTSTALYYQSLIAMQKMANVLDKDDAAEIYAKRAAFVKKVFNDTFFDASQNSYGSQTGNVFALFSKIVPEEKEQAVADNLASLIMEKENGHYTTGIFGHRPLYTVLNDYGYLEVTKHLWSITDYPSLGFLTEEHDLTTWPEVPYHWKKGRRYLRNSFNHPMHSGFAASFHESLGGIRPDEKHPGFKHFFLKPSFLPELTWVEVSHKSPYGVIRSSWKRKKNTVVWSFSVPENTSAEIQLTAYSHKKLQLNGVAVKRNVFVLQSGEYTLTVKEK